MAKCNIQIPIRDPKVLFAAVSQLARQNNGTIQGDETGGSFMAKTDFGTLAGTYRVDPYAIGGSAGYSATIIITKKPLIATCSRISKEIRKFVAAKEAETPRQTPTEPPPSAPATVTTRRPTSGPDPEIERIKARRWSIFFLLAAPIAGALLARSR